MLVLILLAFIAIAGALAWYLLSHDHGPKEPILALWFAFGMGAIGALIAYFLETKLLAPGSLTAASSKESLLSTTMVVAAIEESCKFIPLALILYGKSFFNEHTDGIIYFALAGLGFGIPENIIYTIQGGSQTGMTRVFLTSVFHACTTAVVGYFLAKQKVEHKSPFIVVIAFVGIVLLHGIYDFGLLANNTVLSIVSVTITLCLTGALFFLFARATDRDQDLGLSIVGNNSFCRSCGSPNPHHNLYCAQCGKNA